MFGFIQKIVASVGLLFASVVSIFGFNQAPEITPTPEPIPVVEATKSPLPSPTITPVIKYIVITPTPAPASIKTPIPVQDNSLKIAICQAQAREEINNSLNKVISISKPLFQQQLDEAHANWVAAKQEQIRRAVEPIPELYGASPEQIRSVRESAANAVQPTIDYYANLEQQIISNWEKANQEARKLAEQQYNSLYLKCLNQ